MTTVTSPNYAEIVNGMPEAQLRRVLREVAEYQERATRPSTMKLTRGNAGDVVFLNLHTPASTPGGDDWSMLAAGIEADGTIYGEAS